MWGGVSERQRRQLLKRVVLRPNRADPIGVTGSLAVSLYAVRGRLLANS